MSDKDSSPLASKVVRQVQQLILGGEFPPGSTLPEVPLAKRFDVSRGTVREALRDLQDLGLVELYMNRGAVVAELSPQRAWEIFSLRAVLEPFAVRLALTSGRMRNGDRAAIRLAFRRIEASALSGDQNALIEADMGFHWAICAPCRHEILLNHLRSLQVRMRQFMFYTKILDSDLESEVNSHRPVLVAVLSGEADRAEAALHRHIIVAGEQLLVRMSGVGTERQRRSALS
ncbi:MAG: GntR family transcriptional regulator [Alphaproteobacteria bacterium]|nr:GntR family transcriptional regulator [Alphaproteobacteria bacterium]